jgi:hypothetical protein
MMTGMNTWLHACPAPAINMKPDMDPTEVRCLPMYGVFAVIGGICKAPYSHFKSTLTTKP